MEFTEPAMRPPQEANSLFLRATQGCSYNDCHFCYVSRGYPFMAVKPEDLEHEAMAYKPFFSSNTKVYLTGSNPFVLPFNTLKTYIAAIRKVFPNFSELSMQSRIDDISRKSDAQLKELHMLGLAQLYIGTENGNEEVLKLMNKGHTAAQTVEELHRLDKAEIAYTTFYVLGLGGKGRGKASGLATAKMFNQVNPRRITTTGMTIFPNTPVAEMLKLGEYFEATEREKIEELLIFLENLNIDTFYDGIHYLNSLNYRFANSNKEFKRRVLEDIREILQNYSDWELEKMVNRKEKHSL
ncbi:MAG: radical SAM protein [Desulfovibrionaceae bacterium]|nr:radical SAM protein [Desulfovibrionaceae bacterium]